MNMNRASKTSRIIAISLFILLIAIILFGFIHSKQRSAKISRCVDNLRTIELIKRDWASNENKTSNDAPSWNDLRTYFPTRWSNNIPVCPSGGAYTIGRNGELPTCSIGGYEHSWH